MTEHERLDEILHLLEQTYPQAKAELVFKNAFELLIATILSAQCTDKQVNKVTTVLFSICPDAKSMGALPLETLETYIKSCGFYHTKAKHILETCALLVQNNGGEVPAEREILERMPGVGRKTANVVLSNAFGQPAIAVDTHVFRVSNRLGLAHAKDVVKTEQQLMQNIPMEKWSIAHHWLIWHGRRICFARNPACTNCPLYVVCENHVGAQTDA